MMDFDHMFVIGCLVCIFAIPAVISAFSDRRWPILPVLMVLIGGGLIYFPYSQQPDVYALAAVPDVIMRVIAGFIH